MIMPAYLKLLMALSLDVVARLKEDNSVFGSSLIEYVSVLVF